MRRGLVRQPNLTNDAYDQLATGLEEQKIIALSSAHETTQHEGAENVWSNNAMQDESDFNGPLWLASS